MRLSCSLIALAVLIGYPAAAEVETLTPEGNASFATLLSGVSYAKVPGGFARNNLEMDLLLPGGEGPHPVVVFVTGNGWRSIDQRALIPQHSTLARAGYAVATIDYRIIGEATFPEPERDVKAAVRFLRANAGRLGIDPDRIGLFGNSAGGHLSLVAGLSEGDETFANEEWADQSDAVQAIVAWYAPAYLTELGDDPLDPENLHLGLNTQDPANAEAVAEANPGTYAGADDPPVLLVHGIEDEVVPIDHSDRLYDELTEAGIDATLVRVEGIGHSFGQISGSPEVTERVIAFLDRTLKDE